MRFACVLAKERVIAENIVGYAHDTLLTSETDPALAYVGATIFADRCSDCGEHR
jgi:hypothetical protein